MSKSILAIDPGTACGWAMRTFCGSTHSGVQKFELKRGESPGMRYWRFERWLGEMIAGIDVIYYEQAHHRGGYATQVGVGFTTIILKVAAENKIETCPVHSATVKKSATGKGNASKAEMIKAAQYLKAGLQDDNEADALHILYYAISEI